jgi:uncharacterized protein involved in outer membrane biogenesis
VVYTALGFLAAPPLLRSLLVKEASAALHRDVAIAKVRVNPLALSVTIDGLAVAHRDGAPFLGWDSLYLRLAPLRLFTGDIGLAEIRLVRPSLHFGLGADGALTFQDFLAPEVPPGRASRRPPKRPARLRDAVRARVGRRPPRDEAHGRQGDRGRARDGAAALRDAAVDVVGRALAA